MTLQGNVIWGVSHKYWRKSEKLFDTVQILMTSLRSNNVREIDTTNCETYCNVSNVHNTKPTHHIFY